MSYFAIAALIITSSFTVNNQQQLNKQTVNGCFDNFRAHRQGKAGIALSWRVASADIVQFVVERSYDADFFENAGTVNFNGSSSYSFKDNGVYPGRIYYRITAIKTDGSTETSAVEMVRIVQHG
jgi:hypothetical protein